MVKFEVAHGLSLLFGFDDPLLELLVIALEQFQPVEHELNFRFLLLALLASVPDGFVVFPLTEGS